MFSIYGMSGPIFQGTLEGLGKMPPVLRRGPVAPVRRIGDQADIGGDSQVRAINTMGKHAVEAYQSILPQNLDRGPLYHASQIMQMRVITVDSEDNVAHVWQILSEYHIHQAPVLDAEFRLVGIIGERNLLTTLNADAGQVGIALDRRVREIMTTPVVAASPITDIRRIAHVMLDHDVGGVPIVNDAGALVGFVSRGDILRAVVTDPPLSIWR